MRYEIYVNAANADPDDDIVAEDVLAESHDDRMAALARAEQLARAEATFTMVYDTGRTSKITGRNLLIAVYEQWGAGNAQPR